ncbi:hypothetical protein [Thermonema rossianum]|uniref:hypothetical protein n=1 Tax=Thermonema rossianum TaxID=55505 RepID=UPI0005714FE2|nr:hypothetical protein [Thermonema rossianum]
MKAYYLLITLLLGMAFACSQEKKEEEKEFKHTPEMSQRLEESHQEWLREHSRWVEEHRKYEELFQRLRNSYLETANPPAASFDSLSRALQKTIEEHAQLLSDHVVRLDAHGETVLRHKKKEVDDAYAQKKEEKFKKQHQDLLKRHDEMLKHYEEQLQRLTEMIKEAGGTPPSMEEIDRELQGQAVPSDSTP